MTDNWVIWADGSIINNGCQTTSIGGFGYLIERSGVPYAMGGGFTNPPSTNNTAEITAVLIPMAYLYKTYGIKEVTFVSDSQYVVNGFNQWLRGWRNNNFNNGQVKNIALWSKCLYYLNNIKINGEWVKGHARGLHPKNEMVDFLAGYYRDKRVIKQIPISTDIVQRYSENSTNRSLSKRNQLLREVINQNELES